jgi:hypothetical protein
MSHRWNRHARIEYYEAIEYYARIDDKLGERFVAAVEAAVEQMSLTLHGGGIPPMDGLIIGGAGLS